jgi:hypothetical protein
MNEDLVGRRAAALESVSTATDDPAEQETADRIRALLAHPATWATPPEIELPKPETELERDSAPAAEPEPVVDLARRRRWRRTISWAAAAAAVAAASVLVVSLLIGPSPESIELRLAGTGQTAGASASVTAIKLEAGWELRLDITDLPGAPEGSYYQGWVVREETFVPLGTFHMRQHGEVRLWAGVAVEQFTEVEITRQQIGDATLGDVVLSGPIPRR